MLSIVTDYVDKFLVWISIVIGASLTVNMVAAVFFRYVLNRPIFWADELSLYLFAWITFLGGSLAVKRMEMAAVTILFDRLHAKAKQFISIIIQICIFLFSAIVLYYSIIWIKSPSIFNQLSPTIPVKLWILYIILPFCMLCIMLFSVNHIYSLLTTGLPDLKEGDDA